MTKFFRMDDRLLEESRKAARNVQEETRNVRGIARNVQGNVRNTAQDMSPRAEMLRLFRDVLEDKTIDMEKARKLLDEDFAKDVNFKGYTDELLLLEVDNMTDMLYEKQGSYLQGKAEGREEGRVEGREEGRVEGLAKGEEKGRKEERLLADAEKLESARAMLAEGDSKEKVCRVLKLSEAQIKAL